LTITKGDGCIIGTALRRLSSFTLVGVRHREISHLRDAMG
jgi:hypothetical protein